MTDQPMTHDEAVDLAAAYVLGALERPEEAAVRAHLQTCGLPHPEFEALGGVVPALLELDDPQLVEPPAGLRDRIMAAAAADLASRGRTTQRTIPFPSAAERTVRPERRAATRASRFDWALRIAAVLAIVALGAWGLNLQSQLDQAHAFDRAVTAVVQAGAQPGAKTVVLAAAPGKQGAGIGAVAADGSVTLALRDLPATSGSQVYTAWVIVGETPTSVGDFSVDATGIRGFTTKPATTPAGATIAVTLEPNPGNTAPKGEVIAAGVAAAAPGATS
jgi:hypothetical protein